MEHPVVLPESGNNISSGTTGSHQLRSSDSIPSIHPPVQGTNASSHVAVKSHSANEASSPPAKTSFVLPISGGSSPKPSETASPSRFSLWSSKWITDWWAGELIYWMIASVSLMAILITLESHKNKPLPEWSFGITLNSLISILATIAQMAMMKPVVECIHQLKWLWFIKKQKLESFQVFDDASRGPLGSVYLLSKLRRIHLISMGAIITIISAAFGPFVQQIVSYPLHLQPTGVRGAATAQQVFNYTGSETFNSELSTSILDGLSFQTNLSAVSPFCSTGNCTWADYSSLGFCSSVTDLSSSIHHNPCNLTSFEEIFESAGIPNPGYPCFNYTLPEIEIGSTGAIDEQSVSNVTLTNAYFNPVYSGSGFMNTMVVDSAYNNVSSVATVYLIYQPGLFTDINTTLPSPIAYGLNLNFCVQTYKTNVSSGVVNTIPLSSQILSTTLEETYHINNDTDSFIDNNTFISVGGDTFGVPSNPLQLLRAQIQAVVNSGPCFESISGNGVACNFAVSLPFLTAVNSTDPLSNITDLWENVATSMTNSLRNGGGGEIQVSRVQGTALIPVAFVKTQYLWLILPISLIVFTLVFLLATMSESKRLGSKVWKSSILATLQGLHGDLHTELGGLSSISEMEEKAKEVKVRFDMTRGVEYRLVEEKRDEYWKG